MLMTGRDRIAHMIYSPLRIVVVLFLVLAVPCCGGNTVVRTGFIPRNIPMMKSAESEETSSYKAKGFALSQYGAVKVEPIRSPPMGDLKVQAEELDELRRRFEAGLQQALKATGGTGDRVLVVRGEITAIKPNNPLLNVAPQTQILKRGYGYAACEIYATDGADGRVVAAWMNTQDTQRIGSEKLSELGTAKKACDEWGPAFRKFLTD